MKFLTLVFLMFAAPAMSQSITVDTTPPTITVMPDVGAQPRTIKSDYSGETYRAGTGYFHDPSGTLGDTTYLIDYKGEAPSIYQLSRIDNKPPKYLFVFKNQKKAQLTTELVGLGLIVAGGALGGKAEYYSRYHGTTSNWDSFHLTRDAGLLTTGAGCTLLGASFALDDDLQIWEVACKLALSAILYRASAEAAYGFMD